MVESALEEDGNGWRDEIGVRVQGGDGRGEADSREGCSESAYNCMHEMHEMQSTRIRCAAWGPDDTHNLWPLPCLHARQGFVVFCHVESRMTSNWGIGKAGLFEEL
jgi:hypothetical protein